MLHVVFTYHFTHKKSKRGGGFTVLIQDESIFTDDVHLGKKYWVDANERMSIR